MFLHPWLLILLLLVPFAGWRIIRKNRRSGIRFSSAATSWHPPPTLRQRLLWIPSALTLLALTLIIVALARPRYGREQTVIRSEGIAIELVVDRSSSMQALDFRIDGQRVDRLQAIKNVVRKFVFGDADRDAAKLPEETLAGRPGDLIGLITFAGFADAITPLTLDHAFVIEQLRQARIVTRRDEDGTAIGDAIALAVDKLDRLADASDVKSKVIILLTDGENTAGEIDPLRAAELAATLDIKIYCIGVGTKGLAPIPVGRSPSGRWLVQSMPVNIDETTLKAMAQATDGQYFRATDTDSLESIYAAIDELEKTEVQSYQYTDFRELAVQRVFLGGYRVPPLLFIAFVLLVTRVILSHTLFRRFDS